MLVNLDLAQPVRDTKAVNLPSGLVATVEAEYERVRKKCFHCRRLTHEKQRCPLLQGQRNKCPHRRTKLATIMNTPENSRQHHTNFC